MAPRHSWAKANNPFWSAHVAAWYRNALDADDYCRRRDLSKATLMPWTRHLLSAEDLRKRAEDLQKLRRKERERQSKNRQPKRRRRSPRHRYSVRTDSGPIALRAFWSMHVEAMNFSGIGHAEYAAALGLSPHALRIWRDRLEETGNEMDWRSLLHPSARDRKWRSFARSNYQIFVAFKQERKCERSFQPRQRRAYGFHRLVSFLQLPAYEMSDHLGVCVRGKTRAGQLELIAQLAMIFDDAVVQDRNAVNRVRMRVLLVWTAMSCPAGVTNAYGADQRPTIKLALEAPEFPYRAPPRQETAFKRGYTGRNRILDIQADSEHPESEQRLALDPRHRRSHTSSSPMHPPSQREVLERDNGAVVTTEGMTPRFS